jgi:hypothetical protein
VPAQHHLALTHRVRPYRDGTPTLGHTAETAYRIPTETNYGEMLLPVADLKIMCTYSDIRWGFIRGIMMGFIRGITLEDHPLRPAKTQVTNPARGSAGIPDSLGHKPEDTSGRASWSTSSHPCLPHLRFLSHLVHTSPSSFYYLILLPSFSLHLCSRRCHSHARRPAHGRFADLHESTGGNGGNSDRTDGFLFTNNDGGVPARKESCKWAAFCIARGAAQSHN